jgi:hypothetical protein
MILRLLTLDGLKVSGTIAVSAAGLTALRAAWRTAAR